MYSQKELKIGKSIRINESIKAEKLRVVGVNGDQLGILGREEALQIAKEAGVDLVEISPNADPPVVKVIDWGKYQYQKMKEQRKSRKNAKPIDVKQMRMGLKIGTNDLDIKLRKIREFLKEGHKVKILVIFKGREMAHRDLGYVMIERIINLLENDAIVEQTPQMAGRNLSIAIRSK